jgi:hypothetical protein
MSRFLEYLDSKGKLKAPVTSVDGDEVDMPAGRKYAPPEGSGGKANAYSNGKSVKHAENGFADEGDKKLKFDYKKSVAPAKIPVAEQLQQISFIGEMAASDPEVIHNLVREMRRQGLFGMFVAEMMTQAETYSHLKELLSNENYGLEIAKKLSKLAAEEVVPPVHKMGDEEEEVEGDDESDEEDEDEAPEEDGEVAPAAPAQAKTNFEHFLLKKKGLTESDVPGWQPTAPMSHAPFLSALAKVQKGSPNFQFDQPYAHSDVIATALGLSPEEKQALRSQNVLQWNDEGHFHIPQAAFDMHQGLQASRKPQRPSAPLPPPRVGTKPPQY